MFSSPEINFDSKESIFRTTYTNFRVIQKNSVTRSKPNQNKLEVLENIWINPKWTKILLYIVNILNF